MSSGYVLLQAIVKDESFQGLHDQPANNNKQVYNNVSFQQKVWLHDDVPDHVLS